MAKRTKTSKRLRQYVQQLETRIHTLKEALRARDESRSEKKDPRI
jgi:hypothetical protein